MITPARMLPRPGAEPAAGRAALGAGVAEAQRQVLAALVEAALTAHRAGTLAELVRGHPRVARWLLRRYRLWLSGQPGDGLTDADRAAEAALVLLRWGVSQLRPDRLASLDSIARADWVDRSAWRPMLAVACHAGLLDVPDFRDRYRRASGESPADNLCGLWGVGTSTFYRHLERGKQRLVELLAERPLSVPRRLALRQVAALRELQRLGLAEDPDACAAWHRRQAQARALTREPAAALWHAWQGGDTTQFVATLTGHALELAGEAETDAAVERVAAGPLNTSERVELALARAALHRHRHAPERELRALEDAQRQAQAARDPLLLGLVHAALGKFHEPRDVDRAYACYEASVGYLRESSGGPQAAAALPHHLTALVRLAWMHVLRNDPRARNVLDTAEAMVREHRPGDDVLGMLEQTWGEYWRRTGDLDRAIASKHRALLIFERQGDKRSVLVTYLNLVSLYGEARQYDRAVACAHHVEAAAREGPVEPVILASTYINLGTVYFWQGDHDQAIVQYERALDTSLRANLRLQANRAHFNLAEAFYKRYAARHQAEDEQRADTHLEALIGAPASELTPALLAAARTLKADTLGGEGVQEVNRLLPTETAVHAEPMADIARHRALLALPVPPEEHARAQLAIASAYQRIALTELRAAQTLLDTHGLAARFGDEFDRLRAGFAHDTGRAEQLAQAWKLAAGDVVGDERRGPLIARLLADAAINKSGYAELCGVSPATASKHLVTLAERGLLVQTGKGPSTRYLLLD